MLHQKYPRSLTYAKVHSGVHLRYLATPEGVGVAVVCGEQHHIITKAFSEYLPQLASVLIVTGVVVSILILYLKTINLLPLYCSSRPSFKNTPV